MRCEDIQEQFIDLLYREEGAPSATPELEHHLRTCPACRRELEELGQTRKLLSAWKDESPLRSVSVARREFALKRRSVWKYLGYAAVAATVLFCFLALSNMEVTWNKSGFSIHTSLFRRALPEQDYYTKGEVRDLMKRALDDSESRTNEASKLLMLKALDTIERDQWMNLRLERGRTARSENRN